MVENQIFCALKEILEKSSEQFGRAFVLREGKVSALEKCCGIIDGIIDESSCESAEVTVNNNTMDVTISLLCPDVVLENGNSHPFFELIQHTSSFGFCNENGMLKVDFAFSGLWQGQARNDDFE